MSGKKLNTEAITSELAGSAFFPIKPVNNRQTDVPSEPPTATAHVGPTDRKPHVAAAMPVPKPVSKPQGAARPYVRRTFDLYEDQLAYLTRASLEERLAGGEGSMNAMVRQALDDFIAQQKRR
jgi:hypothetical protein